MKSRNKSQRLIEIIPAIRALLTHSKASPVISFKYSKTIDAIVADKRRFLKALNGESGIFVKVSKDSSVSITNFIKEQETSGFQEGLICLENIGNQGHSHGYEYCGRKAMIEPYQGKLP